MNNQVDDYLSWEKLDEVKLFLEDELKRHGCILNSWHEVDTLPVDVNDFTYNSVEYHMFVSKRNYQGIGFGIMEKNTALVVVPNTRISYNNDYKTTIKGHLETIFKIKQNPT